MGNINSVKMALVGESGVGKTNIVRRLVRNTFDKDQISTDGGKFYTRTDKIKNKDIPFYIWDTSGKEKYKNYARFFYKDAQVIILVYDVTNKESFNAIKNFWIEDIKTYNPNAKCK